MQDVGAAERKQRGGGVLLGDGRGPGQVWPEVNVFSWILLAAAASSVTGRRGASEGKGALHVPAVGTAVFPPYSLSTIYFWENQRVPAA